MLRIFLRLTMVFYLAVGILCLWELENSIADISSLEVGKGDFGPEETQNLDFKLFRIVSAWCYQYFDMFHLCILRIWLRLQFDQVVVTLLRDVIVKLIRIELELLQQLVFFVYFRVVNLHDILVCSQFIEEISIVPLDGIPMDGFAHVALVPC